MTEKRKTIDRRSDNRRSTERRTESVQPDKVKRSSKARRVKTKRRYHDRRQPSPHSSTEPELHASNVRVAGSNPAGGTTRAFEEASRIAQGQFSGFDAIAKRVLGGERFQLFVTQRLESFAKRPRMWGSHEALELCAVQLIELEVLHYAPEIISKTPRAVIEAYQRELWKRHPEQSNRYLNDMKLEAAAFTKELCDICRVVRQQMGTIE